MNTTTNLSSLIWSSADDVLRGIPKLSKDERAILPFVAMRRLDCVLEAKKGQTYALHVEYNDKVSKSDSRSPSLI